jgi:excisionase family DNA binding protein
MKAFVFLAALLLLGADFALARELIPSAPIAIHEIATYLSPAIAMAAVATEIEPIFVSVLDAAEILATSRAEIYQRIARGELDAVKDRSRTKITIESIKRYAASRPKATIKLYKPHS